MADQSIRPNQEEAALLAFDEAVASGQDSKTAVGAVIRRFPACAALLADYALARVMESTGPIGDATALEARVIDRADVLLATRMAGLTSAARARIGFVSLLSIIKERGSDVSAIAKSTAIGTSVLTKLDRRLVDITTIPRTLVDSLASVLDIAAIDIWRYLAQPPTLSPTARYRARKSPELASGGLAKSFASAIATAVTAGELTTSNADMWRDAGPLGPPEGANEWT